MRNRTLPAALAALTTLLAGAALAQQAPPIVPVAPAPRVRQGGARTPRVQVCTMKLEVLKAPKEAFTSDFQGKPVLFCCADCKAAFEKLDDAGKEKAVKKSTLTGRKLTLQKQLEDVEKQLKEMEAAPAEIK